MLNAPATPERLAMIQVPQDSQFIPFLMELRSQIARWLNPDLSERQGAILAGDFLINVSRGPADPPEPGREDAESSTAARDRNSLAASVPQIPVT